MKSSTRRLHVFVSILGEVNYSNRVVRYRKLFICFANSLGTTVMFDYLPVRMTMSNDDFHVCFLQSHR